MVVGGVGNAQLLTVSLVLEICYMHVAEISRKIIHRPIMQLIHFQTTVHYHNIISTP